MTAETEERLVQQLTTLVEQAKYLSTKEDLAKLETRTLKWVIALIVPIYAAFIALILTLVPHLK
jgi:hypothetical protein